MKTNKLKMCWIKGNPCFNQTNDVRKCIECSIWSKEYRNNNNN